MSTDNVPGILDAVTRHQERSDGKTSDAIINAHENLDELVHIVAHGGRVTAISEAITKIRALADTWTAEANTASANNGDVRSIILLQQHVTALNDLAFQLLSKVDES